MKVFIEKSEYAYVPEAYAYQSFLKNKNFDVSFGGICSDSNIDIYIKFMGFSPFWSKRYTNKNIMYIHEYHSLSTPPYPKIKDFIKRYFNVQPAARIFLNNTVKESLGFNDDNIPYLFRDMGIDDSLFNINNQDAEFDIIYCGSIDGRIGLVDEIIRLANLGFRLLVVGKLSQLNVEKMLHKNIKLVGAVARQELSFYYAKAKFGLNFTPNIYPYNIQTSTKVLEYCAAGLGVISNRYQWIEQFAKERNANFIYTDQLLSMSDVQLFDFNIPDVADLEWHRLLGSIKFDDFLKNI